MSQSLNKHFQNIAIRDLNPRIVHTNNALGDLVYYAWTPIWHGPTRKYEAEAIADLENHLNILKHFLN